MATIGRLAVKIDADTAGLSTGLSQADGKVKAFEGRIGAMSDSMSLATAAAGALGVALAGGGLLSKLVTVQREFDVLNASMITMTGSAAAAQKEFAWLKDFAATTPFALNEVVGAFVKMQALGLEPTQAALESFGNTASAMGKSLNQMIEAVADASTGEFERLKEFGIKAKKEGDNVSLTFQGVTTTIRNSADEINGYLEGLGKNEFAGAMAERAKTLDGAISNLGDSWDELFRTVNESGVGDVMAESARGAATALGKLSEGLRENRVEVQALAGAVAGGALLATLPAIAAGLGKVALGIRAIGLAMAANPLTLALLGIGAAVGGAVAYQNAMDKTTDGMRRLKMELESTNNGILNMKGLAGMSASEKAAYDDRVAKIKEISSALAAADAPTGSVGSGDTALRKAEAAAGGGSTGGARTGGGVGGGGKATGGKATQTDAQKAAEDAMKKAEEVEAFFASIQEKTRQREIDGLTKFVEGLKIREEARLQSGLSEQERAEEQYQLEYERLLEAKELLALTEEEYSERLLQIRMDRDTAIMDADIAMLDHEQKMADERVRINQKAEEMITSARESATGAAIALLGQMAGKSKGAALAHIALGKAVAIADIMRHTAVAQMNAMAQLGPIAGPPAAAKIGVMGKIQAGIVAASGLMQAASVGSNSGGGSVTGGSGGGSSGRETGGAAAAPGMQQTITIQGIGAGDIFGGESVRLLIDKLIDAQRNGAKILLA